MTPTNEQVVAACQRAGIRSVYIETPGVLFYTDDDGVHDIHPHRDSCEGSALFIVAVLGALHQPVDGIASRSSVLVNKSTKGCQLAWKTISAEGVWREHDTGWYDTLTVACMVAIVAAFPPLEVEHACE